MTPGGWGLIENEPLVTPLFLGAIFGVKMTPRQCSFLKMKKATLARPSDRCKGPPYDRPKRSVFSSLSRRPLCGLALRELKGPKTGKSVHLVYRHLGPLIWMICPDYRKIIADDYLG